MKALLVALLVGVALGPLGESPEASSAAAPAPPSRLLAALASGAPLPATAVVDGVEVDFARLLPFLPQVPAPSDTDDILFLGKDEGFSVTVSRSNQCMGSAVVFVTSYVGFPLMLRPTGTSGFTVRCQGIDVATIHGGATGTLVHDDGWRQYCLGLPGWVQAGECHLMDFQTAGMAGPCVAFLHIYIPEYREYITELFTLDSGCFPPQAGAAAVYATIL